MTGNCEKVAAITFFVAYSYIKSAKHIKGARRWTQQSQVFPPAKESRVPPRTGAARAFRKRTTHLALKLIKVLLLPLARPPCRLSIR
eukprot:5210924-Pyramimonas_sp.AAC.1